MQQVYQPQDSMQANMLLGMLASEGIRGHLQGEHLLGAMGELPALGLLGIWVADTDAPRAMELIRAYEQAVPCLREEESCDGSGPVPGSLQC